MAQGTLVLSPELLLELFKNGAHRYAVSEGVPDDAAIVEVAVDAGNIELVFESETTGGIVVPVAETLDAPPPEPAPPPIHRKLPPEHGSLHPTDGRSGVTTPIK